MKGRVVVVLFLLLLLVGVGFAAAAGSSVGDRSGGSISFLSDRSGMVNHGEVDVIDSRGVRVRQLVRDVDAAAWWSPNGRMLAFLREVATTDPSCSSSFDLYLVDADGRGERRLVKGIGACGPPDRGSLSWSPDSSTIAFVRRSSRNSNPEIWSVDVAREKLRRLTGAPRPPYVLLESVVWSPDGRRIAFVESSIGATPGALYVMKADGRGERLVRQGDILIDATGWPLSWAPGGERLVYDSRGGVSVVDVRTGSSRGLRLPPGVGEVAWSPDGKWIAVGGTHGILLVKPNGTGMRQLLPLSYTSAPSWSPDSKSIAVEGQGGTEASPGPVTARGPVDIWVVPIDGRRARRVTQGWRYGTDAYDAQWQPTGAPLAALGGRYVSPAFASTSLQVGSSLESTRPVARLAADGSRVVLGYVAGAWGTGRTEVWKPATRTLTVLGSDWCPSPDEPCLGVAIAGERVAELFIFTDAPRDDSIGLLTGTVAAPRMDFGQGSICAGGGWQCLGTPIDDVVGGGSLLVFDTWATPCQLSRPGCTGRPKRDGRLFRLDATEAVEIASSTGALTPLSVDAGRILVDHEDGTIDIRTKDGTIVRSFSFDPSLVKGARLQGNDLVVQTPTAIEITDADTGAFRRRWPLPAPDATLTDLQDGIAVLVAGTDIHLLRLSDGHDAVIHTPGAGHVLAQLDASGLFYSYTANDSKYPGRVVFVPYDRLPLR